MLPYILGGAMLVGAGAFVGRAAVRAMRRTKGIGGQVGKFLEGGFQEEMDRSEAAQILGVSERATKAEVNKAHRAIMIKNHPDSGGSTFLSSKINEARDMLSSNKGKEKDEL